MPQPIVEKFLEPNYLLMLQFQEGFVFGRIANRRLMRYAPYNIIDSNGNAIDIASGSNQTELRFRDPRNTENDILYLDSATNSGYPWFMHGAIGVRPENINLYPRFPEGSTIPGKFPNIDPIRPADGDNTGYVSANESPYDEPTDWVEYVIPPRQHLGAEYYNEDDARSLQPVLNLTFALYWFEPLTPSNNAALIRDIANRRKPASILTVGWGNSPHQLGQSLCNDWGVRPLTLRDAQNLNTSTSNNTSSRTSHPTPSKGGY